MEGFSQVRRQGRMKATRSGRAGMGGGPILRSSRGHCWDWKGMHWMVVDGG